MKTRVITGALFGLVFLTVLALGQWPFLLFCSAIAAIGVYEFGKMSEKKSKVRYTLLAMSYVLAGVLSFYDLRETQGLGVIIYLLIIIWSTDSFAYLVGRKIGKTKLAPKISPNKTWEGAIGGTVVATALASIYLVAVEPIGMSLWISIIVTILLSITGQIGDLLESFVKRYYGVKDSGNILPGHGGILDRFDSLLLVSIIAFLVL